jgi:hypothetical protein
MTVCAGSLITQHDLGRVVLYSTCLILHMLGGIKLVKTPGQSLQMWSAFRLLMMGVACHTFAVHPLCTCLVYPVLHANVLFHRRELDWHPMERPVSIRQPCDQHHRHHLYCHIPSHLQALPVWGHHSYTVLAICDPSIHLHPVLRGQIQWRDEVSPVEQD